MMELAALQQIWPLPGPWQAQPLSRGTNNLVLRVNAPGGSYVLRVYHNHASVERLRLEHGILATLRALDLPFAVPLPLPTRQRTLYARLPAADGDALATRAAFIPGEHPHRDDLAQAHAAGGALGALDIALAQVALHDAGSATSWRTSGDLSRCHPLVPDPLAAIAELPLLGRARQRLVRRYGPLNERVRGIYAVLPRQLLYEDCGPGNMLMQDDRVSGILDFEFRGRDLRVMDLAVAHFWWAPAGDGRGAA